MKIEKYGTAGDIQELLAVRDGIDALVNAHVAGDPMSPRADLIDIGDAYQVHVEVPGVEQSDLEIAVQGRDLLIAGLREPILPDHEAVFIERPAGPFQRTIQLPGRVDEGAATAYLAAGVLVVTLPKAER
jgi:HSP20 family protein